MDRDAAGDAEGRPGIRSILADTRGHEVHEVAAGAVPDEEHPGDVRGLAEELSRGVLKSAGFGRDDGAEATEHVDAGVYLGGEAVLGG